MRWFLACALFPLLVACGGTDAGGADRADDPVGPSDPPTLSDPPPRPSAGPAAPGDVVSRELVTVMDDGDGPQACLGAIAESYPPQCSGPPIEGWDWEVQGRYAERASGSRWGEFALRGTWDGATLTLAEAVPAALYDARPVGEPDYPTPSVERTPRQLEELAEELGRTLPGAQGAWTDRNGHVLASVTYDDGSLQEWVDDTYGAGVVVVTGQFVDV